MRQLVSTLLEVAGTVALVYGAYLLASWAGWLVGGAALMIVGLALDPPQRTER